MNISTGYLSRFELPDALAYPLPSEERQIPRDHVRLLVSEGNGAIHHTLFRNLDRFLKPGDILVVNTSATVNAALNTDLPGNRPGRIHFSRFPGTIPACPPKAYAMAGRLTESERPVRVGSDLGDNHCLVEIRSLEGSKTVRWKEGKPVQEFKLPGGASLELKERYYSDSRLLHLWIARLRTNRDIPAYLEEFGSPITYRTDEHYPLSYYQTLFSFRPGSAEMPSAARGFTPELVDRLLKKGIAITPVLLHTGVSSLEKNEAPYPEYMEIDPVTVSIINRAKSQGKRIIAVGTTVMRALESAADDRGRIRTFRGYTGLYINEDFRSKVADGMITGFHEPKASHLHIIRSVANNEHIESAYKTAIAKQYFWHHFGDLHLILP